MHLKENAQRNLLAQNVPEKSRSRVISTIFGSTCLIYSYARVEYVERELEIKQEFAEFGGKYLEEKLLSTIREKIFSPRLENRIIPPIGKTIVSQ